MSALPTTARDLARAVEAAMHAGDTDLLHALAPCQCCCDEHTYGEACPAWSWGGCRGGNPYLWWCDKTGEPKPPTFDWDERADDLSPCAVAYVPAHYVRLDAGPHD